MPTSQGLFHAGDRNRRLSLTLPPAGTRQPGGSRCSPGRRRDLACQPGRVGDNWIARLRADHRPQRVQKLQAGTDTQTVVIAALDQGDTAVEANAAHLPLIEGH